MRVLRLMAIGVGFLAVAATARAEDEYGDLLHLTNETELGYLLVAGNSDAETFHVKQGNGFSWGANRILSAFSYVRSAANGTLSARSLATSLRYERKLFERVSGYAGGGIESNRFAGFDPRYLLDVGGRWVVATSDAGLLATELGYRYQNEERIVGGHRAFSLLRVYVEAEKKLQELLMGRIALEVLPNLTLFDDVQINGEVSLIVRLSAIFSLKWGYQVRFRNVPAAPGLKKADTQLTGAILAKF